MWFSGEHIFRLESIGTVTHCVFYLLTHLAIYLDLMAKQWLV
jgi:hypothetical protein